MLYQPFQVVSKPPTLSSKPTHNKDRRLTGILHKFTYRIPSKNHSYTWNIARTIIYEPIALTDRCSLVHPLTAPQQTAMKHSAAVTWDTTILVLFAYQRPYCTVALRWYIARQPGTPLLVLLLSFIHEYALAFIKLSKSERFYITHALKQDISCSCPVTLVGVLCPLFHLFQLVCGYNYGQVRCIGGNS